VRICADHHAPLDADRRQITRCGGPCRAARSRARAAAAEETLERRVRDRAPLESAQSRTRDVREAVACAAATVAVDPLAEPLLHEYPDMWDAA
jgi:hypothetical protein